MPRAGAGDRAMSRQYSAEALRQYQGRAVAPPVRRAETVAPAPFGAPSAGTWGGTRRPPAAAPDYAPRSPGLWNAVMAGALLSAITSNSGNAGWFAQHRNDPGYAQWRAAQDEQAKTDPALAERLRKLDQGMAQVERTGAAAPTAESGGGVVWLVLLVAAGVFVLLWLARRRGARAAASPRSVTTGPDAGPNPFRRGMVLAVDPSPFLLTQGTTHLRPPESDSISVEAVGQLRHGSLALWRLYLPGGETFLQFHLDPSGTPDECRWFERLDELTPANADEWGFWLDPGNGAIGWPSFQTKDGKTYARSWAAGESWVEPQEFAERIDGPQGLVERRLRCMLYAAPTGVSPPGPPAEYLLVAAVDQDQQAWVALHTGIDINPASLNLPIAALRPTGAFA